MLSAVLSASRDSVVLREFSPCQAMTTHSLSTNWIDRPLHEVPCPLLESHDSSGRRSAHHPLKCTIPPSLPSPVPSLTGFGVAELLTSICRPLSTEVPHPRRGGINLVVQ